MQDIYDRIEALEQQNKKQRDALIAILNHLSTCDGTLYYATHNRIRCPQCDLCIEDDEL